MSDKAKSYRNTALIAVSSVINILFSVVKNKFLAIFLGPSGIGKFGILSDFVGTVYSIGSFGVSNSGVQAIAKASTESNEAVKKTYNTLVFIYTILSVIIVTGVCVLAPYISVLLIKNESLTWFLRIVSLSIAFKFRSAIQGNLITGLQRVGLLAKGTAMQGFIAMVVGIALGYFLGINAVPYLVLSLGMGSWVVTFIQSRKILKELPTTKERFPIKQMFPIFLIGISTTWSGVLESTVSIVSKGGIARKWGQDFVGYYQVAIGFTYTYISFITQSITSDYYPRLVTTISKGSDEVAKFVNHQISISMNLVTPILLIMLTFSKLFVTVLFSTKFLLASELINYTVAGTFILVVAWPIGYVFLAHRATKIYIVGELIGNLTLLLFNFAVIYFGRKQYDFPLIGLAYVLHFIIYLFAIVLIFYKKFNGYITKENIKTFSINAFIITGIIIAKIIFNPIVVYILGSALIAIFFYVCRNEYLFMLNSILNKKK